MIRIDMSDYSRAAGAYWAALVAAGAVALGWGAYHCLAFSGTEWAQLVVLASLVVISGMLPGQDTGDEGRRDGGRLLRLPRRHLPRRPGRHRPRRVGAVHQLAPHLPARIDLDRHARLHVRHGLRRGPELLPRARRARRHRGEAARFSQRRLARTAHPAARPDVARPVHAQQRAGRRAALAQERAAVLALLARRLPLKLLDVLRGRARGRRRLRGHQPVRTALRHPEHPGRRRHARHLPHLLRARRREDARGRRGLAPPPRHRRGARHRHRRQRPDDALSRPARPALLRAHGRADGAGAFGN